MKFRPCIDLHSGQVKQIVGSTLVDDKQNALAAKSESAPAENFATDKPAKEYAEMYKRDGLTGGHVIMLGPGNQEAVSSCAYPEGILSGDFAMTFFDVLDGLFRKKDTNSMRCML